jgi:hypothetical protein
VAKKKKIPAIVKQIKKQPVNEVNYATQKSISYSQLSMYTNCPRKWSLQYKDGHYTSEASIHMTFGTALHETLQHYITTIYEVSGAAADRIDLDTYFEERFRETYLKDYTSNKKIHFSDPVQMREFFEDGLEIIKAVKKNRAGIFGKRGWHLIGCEVPIVLTPLPQFNNVLYKGYLDVVLYNETYNEFKILDIKTSTKGWSDYEKKDETKQFQLILYKYFFAKQFGVEIDKIDIEFFIVKRKIWKDSPFPISRIQEFTPASGKVKVNKAVNAVTSFIEGVFNTNGSYKDVTHEPNPSLNGCKYCPFKDNKELCDKGIS